MLGHGPADEVVVLLGQGDHEVAAGGQGGHRGQNDEASNHLMEKQRNVKNIKKVANRKQTIKHREDKYDDQKSHLQTSFCLMMILFGQTKEN